jgi:hypothetical protein
MADDLKETQRSHNSKESKTQVRLLKVLSVQKNEESKPTSYSDERMLKDQRS